ncbi:MAG: pilus assembly protein [Brevundimonas sp.]|uniref:TadE/TadG family type IV pilus assembly protein n=1 Tax=Brevundimonas sp. TaxID=1871086 RepID=UPI00272711EB|nr:TadE/TadG family type IV pilus assembly protein [Brevundimonas sp.]MDO9607814.1 pilus assembly protein [Brevundimonas sp.]
MASQLIHRTIRRLRSLGARLRHDRRGNVAIIFALSLPAIVMLTLGGVDLHRITTARSQLQDALDAATLAAARSSETTSDGLKSVALATLHANLQDTEVEPINDADVSVSMNSNNVVIATAQGQVKTLVANIVLPPYGQLLDDTLSISTRSEVNRSSRDVEVALALDITGSMDNCTRNCPAVSKIAALKTAAKELIDIVVQTNQSPYYSKVALAPYSMGVNLGSYADTVRGPLSSTTRSVTAATWLTGSVKTITGVSRASTATITSSNHGFANGDKVVIWSSERMTALNGVALTVANVKSNTFDLVGVNSRNYSAFSGEAYVAKCARTDCAIVITASQHGLSNQGDAAHLSNMGGLAQLNGIGFRVAQVTATTATLALDASVSGLSTAAKGGAAYTSGGLLACGYDTCTQRDFVNATGEWTRYAATNCVSERVGSAAYSDAAPTSSSARVGRNYASPSNTCPSVGIVPLTNVKKTLTDQIDKLVAAGSTAGHIGLAWGWYLVSPNFGVWTGASAPAAYDTNRTLKAVVLMTDGEFNTPYFRGVIASNAGDGSGGSDTHINQTATNGSSFAQAFELCQNMQAAGVIVYTVGFDIPDPDNIEGDIDSAGELMQRCASTPGRAFQATSSTDLSDAFRDIGHDITRLRISK